MAGAGGAEGSGGSSKREAATGRPTTPPLSADGPPAAPTVSALRDLYLAWLEAYRSPALRREVARHLGRFCEREGDRPAVEVEGAHLESFQASLSAAGHAALYVRKHATSVRAMFGAGARRGWLPRGFRPFADVEAVRVEPKPLLESHLPTDDEVRRLIQLAKPDFASMLRVYHATGARTHELIEASIGDFQPASRCLVLGRHKRASTLREYRPRTILLNDEAYAIVEGRCKGDGASPVHPTAPIFPNGAGKPFTSCLQGDMFARLRKRAGVRPHVTIYSLRHLWISDMLMAGLDVLLVAKMAGTSAKMVESTYGHFKTSSFREAQAKLDQIRIRRGEGY